MKKQISAGLLAILPAISYAADPWTFNTYFENDLFDGTDQSYTNGVRFSWVSPDLDNYLLDERIPLWLRRINAQFSPLYPVTESYTDNVQRKLIFTIGQEMYTPTDKKRKTVDPDDRPFAGWLYAGFGYHAKTDNKMNSVEVNLGVVGPASYAHETQDFIHDLRGIETFQGWDNQLRNELGIQVVYEHKHRLYKNTLYNNISYDFITHAGGSVGNVATYGNLGAEYRIGWNLPDDFGTSALRPGGDNSAPGNSDPRLRYEGRGIHGFISIDARAVLHNIFLDGNTFTDSHSVDKEYFVADAAIGVSAIYDRWKISYAHVHRTKEFRSQKKPQRFGSISVSYSY
ncbi:lipid A deacylase LpxR family protein [Neptunomonas sp.]|uniref:lipid A deacylase LpxR family protein n=1 Tax=Neptunomonas TaxID=75687 RepID=UPI003517C957